MSHVTDWREHNKNIYFNYQCYEFERFSGCLINCWYELQKVGPSDKQVITKISSIKLYNCELHAQQDSSATSLPFNNVVNFASSSCSKCKLGANGSFLGF